MESGLLHLHNVLRYAILLILLIAIIRSFSGWMGKKEWGGLDNKLGLFLTIFVHTQFLLGFAIYFMKGWQNHLGNMSDANIRLRALEHPLIMLIAVVLITIGRSKSKKASNDVSKHKVSSILWLIALVLILSRMPSWSLPEM